MIKYSKYSSTGKLPPNKAPHSPSVGADYPRKGPDPGARGARVKHGAYAGNSGGEGYTSK